MLLKKATRADLRKFRRLGDRTADRFVPAELTETLAMLGIRAGDVLLAHVAYRSFLGFLGGPSDVLVCLRDAVCPSGTLLMPSMPFIGSAVDYVQSGQVFDVRLTPSRMGVVTELFRGSPGTVRSLHPTHPVLANGPMAEELLCDHQLARTPCGEHSPFAKLPAAKGKIVLLGTGIDALTFYHYLEEVLEHAFFCSPFTEEMFAVPFLGSNGEALHVHTRLFDPGLSRRRDLGILERELKAAGVWREQMVGSLQVVVLEAQIISDTLRAMVERGVYCYVRAD